MLSLRSTRRLFTNFAVTMLFLSAIGGIFMTEAQAADTAIRGYDTVAYFTDAKAVKGVESYSFTWHNLTWHFVSKEHRDLFAADPAKYAPQYDGFCAWAMTESRLAYTDPEVWKVVDNKLYLNCSPSAFEKWSRDIPGNIKKADAIWLKMQSGK